MREGSQIFGTENFVSSDAKRLSILWERVQIVVGNKKFSLYDSWGGNGKRWDIYTRGSKAMIARVGGELIRLSSSVAMVRKEATRKPVTTKRSMNEARRRHDCLSPRKERRVYTAARQDGESGRAGVTIRRCNDQR